MQLADILKTFVGQNNVSVSGSDSVSSSNTQLLNQYIKALTPGQIISGEVTDISGDMLKLLVSQNGEQISLMAKLEQNIALQMGKNILFQVKNNGSTLSLSPLYENMTMEKTAALALEQANIPMTEATLALTGTLMREGMPIDKDSLTSMYQQVMQFGKEKLQNIVDLHKLQLPVTAENLEQMENYKGLGHQLVQGIDQLGEELTGAIKGLAEQGKSDTASQLLKAILQPLEESREGIDNKILLREEGVLSSGKDTIVGLLSKAGDSKEMVKELLTLLDRRTELPMKELAGDERFVRALKDMLKQELMLSPEETTKEKIKELYHKLETQLQNIIETLDKSSMLDSTLGKNVTQMQQNVNFLNQMNQMYAYIQLPLKLSGHEAHGELYVYSNKKRLSGEDGEISALLHLDMDNLGPLDVYVAMQYEKVSTQFYLQDEELLDFMNEHMDMLTKRLQDRGYEISVTTSVRKSGGEEGNSCMKELLKTHSNIPLLATDSFDVRA